MIDGSGMNPITPPLEGGAGGLLSRTPVSLPHGAQSGGAAGGFPPVAAAPPLEEFLSAAAPHVGAGDEERLQWAVQELETYFLEIMWKTMRQTIPDGGLIDEGMSVEVFEGMLDEERSRLMAASGGVGLGDMLYEQLSVHLPTEENRGIDISG